MTFICPWGCGWEGSAEEYLQHYLECPSKVCPKCGGRNVLFYQVSALKCETCGHKWERAKKEKALRIPQKPEKPEEAKREPLKHEERRKIIIHGRECWLTKKELETQLGAPPVEVEEVWAAAKPEKPEAPEKPAEVEEAPPVEVPAEEVPEEKPAEAPPPVEAPPEVPMEEEKLAPKFFKTEEEFRSWLEKHGITAEPRPMTGLFKDDKRVGSYFETAEGIQVDLAEDAKTWLIRDEVFVEVEAGEEMMVEKPLETPVEEEAGESSAKGTY